MLGSDPVISRNQQRRHVGAFIVGIERGGNTGVNVGDDHLCGRDAAILCVGYAATDGSARLLGYRSSEAEDQQGTSESEHTHPFIVKILGEYSITTENQFPKSCSVPPAGVCAKVNSSYGF